jgi:hydroxyacylglutathione hydrolase
VVYPGLTFLALFLYIGMVLLDLTLYCLVYPGLTFLALFLYLGMVQKRSRSSRCSCHPDRLSTLNIVSHQLRLGYSIYNTWLGKYIHTWKLAEASNNKHTNTTQINLCENCSILPVPFLEDNYSYLICCHNTGHVAAVDAGDAAAIEAAMQQLVVPETCPRPHLTTLLTTHGHWDHDGGNQELLASYPSLVIVGGKGDGVSCCNTFVKDNDTVQVGHLQFRCVWTPCHTPYHMCYYLESKGKTNESKSMLFSGDTLFVGGVGRFWEGQASDMKYSLDVLKKLPSSTHLFPGHEYAVKNLMFNSFVEPTNIDIKIKLKECQKNREVKLQNVPSVLLEELRYNSFLRAKNIPLKVESAGEGGDHEVDCLYTMRRAKDSNKGPALRHQ